MDFSKGLHPDMAKRMYLFLLWLINKKEMHGYEILMKLKNDPGAPNAQVISASRLYPVLNGMLSAGLISQKEMKTGKRVRKVYVVTARGRKMLREGKKMFTGLVGKFVMEMCS